MIRLSVVICFRDWGLDRLALAIRSHRESSLGDAVEIIVSDYGSADVEAVRSVVEGNGAIHVRTETNGPWSRSRALNAGVSAARGQYVITTDADMLFTPEAHAVICGLLQKDSGAAQLLQCRDLSPDYNAETIKDFNWDAFEKNSTLRPRWGMGGMIAFDVRAYEAIRGYDERMEIYGGEDIDFANRLRRFGLKLNWIDDLACRIFHIWHESSRKAADSTPEGRAAITLNREIMLSDKTWVRNLDWKYARPGAAPLVTVAIATYNRASYLRDCIRSVLMQTVQDFEIVIVDDGSTDYTEDAVRSFADPRIRYFRQENQGVSVARNRALAEARAQFIVVQDDDDIMLPWRIEAHFEKLTEGVHGTYGGWVDFRDDTGELVARPGKEFGVAQMMYSGGVMAHGTLMIRTDVIRAFGYDPGLRAGTDYNLAIRMTMSGVRLQHTGKFHILRRFHGGNLTDIISDHQKESARRTTSLFRRYFSPQKETQLRDLARNVAFVNCSGSGNLQASVGPYLPDRLTSRDASVRLRDPEAISKVVGFAEGHGVRNEVHEVRGRDGSIVEAVVWLFDVSLDHLQALRAAAIGVRAEPVLQARIDGAQPRVSVLRNTLVEQAADLMPSGKRFYCFVAVPGGGDGVGRFWDIGAEGYRLIVADRRPYMVGVKAFETLAEALEYAESTRPVASDMEPMVLQRAS
ncbi:glycosyltransferase [Arenimonas fontis]|uniref:Glycosyltransferase n=1 Tax=Arenimonas fontis TaxID=2608255 RepID=A0A5B2Z9P6_9GAMM|nr:glycosyltransferase [Arenimonas fontis]KAA2285368.1 glycosyltransferase [Arenimonas fontis]